MIIIFLNFFVYLQGLRSLRGLTFFLLKSYTNRVTVFSALDRLHIGRYSLYSLWFMIDSGPYK